jgi:hypothetical protein
MKKILVLGHSHLAALKKAKPVDNNFEFHRLPDQDQEVNALLSQLDSNNYRLVIFLIRGNYHNVFGLVNPPARFDFYLPENVNLPVMKDVKVIPVNLVAKIFQVPAMNNAFSLAAKLAQFFKNNTIYQIESPPPLPEELVQKYPGPFKEKIAQRGISSAAFRYKLWRLHSKAVQENCEKIGISFLEIPKGVQNNEGLLAEKYWNPDPTHGNELYGALVLNQIRALQNNIDKK